VSETVRYRDVYIGGPDLVMPVLRGHAEALTGAPYRISPFFPHIGRNIFDEVVNRIRAGGLPGREMAQACWCALLSPPELTALLDDMYGEEGLNPPCLHALRDFVAALPRDCTFALVAQAF